MKAKKRGNWNAVVCLFVCFSRSALTDPPITLRPAGVTRLITCHRSLGMVAATSLYQRSSPFGCHTSEVTRKITLDLLTTSYIRLKKQHEREELHWSLMGTDELDRSILRAERDS